jgi:hypothetical protein
MLAKPEQYKGISFIRISSLPVDQRAKIRKDYNRESIIKILKDNTLLNDCIVYDEYVKWYNAANKSRGQVITSPIQLTSLKLIKK